MTYPIRAGSALLLLLATAGPSLAQEEEEGFLATRLEMLGEYDDNVTLGSAIGEDAASSDFVLRLRPRLSLAQPFGQHLITADVRLDGRRGTDTDLSELNASAVFGSALRFDGGLELGLYGNLLRTRFDQAVYLTPESVPTAGAGVSQTDTRTVGVSGRFAPGERLSFEGLGEYTHDAFDFSTGEELGDARDIWRAGGRVTVPVLRRAVLYGNAGLVDQDAERRGEYRYQDRRYVLGTRIEGPRRFTFFAEAGHEEIDYRDAPGIEFSHLVLSGGLEANISEDLFVRGSAGRDGYGKAVFDAIVFRSRPDDWQLRLVARKSSEPSYSGRTLGRFFEATLYSAGYRRPLGVRWTVDAEASYLLIRAKGEGDARQDDRTSTARLRLERKLGKWLFLGANYRHNRRTALSQGDEFTDNRVGLVLGFSYDRGSVPPDLR